MTYRHTHELIRERNRCRGRMIQLEEAHKYFPIGSEQLKAWNDSFHRAQELQAEIDKRHKEMEIR